MPERGSLPSWLIPYQRKPHSTPELGGLPGRHPVLMCPEKPPSIPLDWIRNFSLSFPITTHSLSIVQHLLHSVIIAFPLWILSSLRSKFRYYFLAQVTKTLGIWALPTLSVGRLLTSPFFSVHWVQPPFCSAPTLCQEGSKHGIHNDSFSPHIIYVI